MKAMPKNLFGSLSDASLEEACEQSLPEMAIAKTGTPEEHTPREAAGIGSRPEPPKDMAAGAGDTGSPVGYAKPCPSTASYAGEAVCGAPSKESGAAMLEKPEVKQLSAFELALNASDDEDENEDEDGQVSGGAQTRSSDFEESQGTPAEVSHSAAGGTCRSDQSGLSSGNSADNTDKETFLPSQELLEKLDDKSTRREDEGLHQYAQLHQYPEESQLGIDVKNLSGAEADTAGELGICAPGVTMHSSPHLTVVNSPTVSTAHYEEPSLVADSAPACLPDSAESSPHTNHDDLPTDNPSICAGVVSPSFTGSASPQGPLDSSPMSSHPALPGLLDESEPDWVVEAEAAQKAQANVAELQQLESQPAGERFSPREVAPSKPHQTPPQGTLELDPGAARSTQIPDPSPTPPEETSATGSCDCSSSAAKILSPERQAIADRFAALQTPADGAASFTGSAFARLAAEVGKQRESKETGEVAAVHSSSRLDHQSDYLLEGPNRTQEVVHGESPTPPLLRMREHEVGADKALHALGTKRSHIGSSPSRERPSASLLSPLKRAVTANARKSPDKGTSDPGK